MSNCTDESFRTKMRSAGKYRRARLRWKLELRRSRPTAPHSTYPGLTREDVQRLDAEVEKILRPGS